MTYLIFLDEEARVRVARPKTYHAVHISASVAPWARARREDGPANLMAFINLIGSQS